MGVPISGLSESDQLSLSIAAVNNSIKPSRCPKCGKAKVAEEACEEGSLCGYSCGGGGWKIYCENCGHTINESECEEAEEA
jgi:hypothetical protein